MGDIGYLPASKNPTSGSPPRILIVDDERLLAWTLGKLLTKAGYDVVIFDNPLLVPDEVRQRPVDLVISDVVMPQMSGIDLAMKLEEQRPGSKFLLLSGQANTLELLAKAKSLGFDFEVYAKPIAPSDLLRLIKARTEQ